MNGYLKCYYCGGENDTSGMRENRLQCQYCRRWISVPSILDQEKQALYDLGKQNMELLRFEEAERSFKALLEKDPSNADASWQALLCHYGVEYILDEASQQNVPTITLLTKEPILEHPYYLQAIQNAESDELRETWKAEAEHINNIMLLYEKVAATEKGYDVFISVKQGTPQGTPTSDSFEAARLMQFLEGKGLRVFNSRFSLKDIIGQEYEPYIMAALLSARAMVVVGSSREYLEAKWVRNEWRRFRWLQENSQEKRILIPYLLGMMPGDVPAEMGVIQCVLNTSASPYADILQAIRRTVPLKVADLKRPASVPAGLAEEEKEKWLKTVRKDLTALEELRDCVMPDLATARNANAYASVIVTNLKNLEGHAEADSLMDEAASLKKHFRSEYERLRLSECDSQIRGFESRIKSGRIDHAEACAIQDELTKLQKEINGYSGKTQARSVQNKINELLDENRKTIARLDPENIVTDPLRHAVAVGKGFIAGLHRDGTVLVSGKKRELVAQAEAWTGIISLAAGDRHLIGLKRDGTLVAVGSNRKKQCDVGQWRNIICVGACADHTVAFDRDGNCFGTGDNSHSQISVNGWKDIVSLATARQFTAASDRSGNVFSTGNPKMRALHTNGWTGIDRVSAVGRKAIGVRSDGEVLLIGDQPGTDTRQAGYLNKKRNLYRSFAPTCGNSFAALAGTGEVRMVAGRFFRLWRLIVLLVVFYIAFAALALTNEFPISDGQAPGFFTFLTIGMVLMGLALWYLIVFALRLSARLKISVSVMKWKKIVEIAGSDRVWELVGLQKDGSVLTAKRANMFQWYEIGLPELDEEG